MFKRGKVFLSKRYDSVKNVRAIEKRKLMQDLQSCTEQNQSLFDITTKILVSETVKVTSFLTETSYNAAFPLF